MQTSLKPQIGKLFRNSINFNFNRQTMDCPQMTIIAWSCSKFRCAVFAWVWHFARMDAPMILYVEFAICQINYIQMEKKHKTKSLQNTFKSTFRRNPIPQKSQTNCFEIEPVWVSKWSFKLCFERKDFSHWLHLNCTSVCLKRCTFNRFSILNLKEDKCIGVLVQTQIWITTVTREKVLTPSHKFHICAVAHRNVPIAHVSIGGMQPWTLFRIIHKSNFV